MNLDYVKENRGLPFVKKGMKVEVYGDAGVITGGNSSGNLNVKFEGQKHSSNCHPKSGIKYFDENGNIIKEFAE